LIPVSEFLADVGPLGRLYIYELESESRGSIWADPQRGVLCHGPQGPEDKLHEPLCYSGEFRGAPPTVELLREDICTRFLVGLESKDVDDGVAFGLASTFSDHAAIWVVDKEDPADCFWEPTVDHFKVTRLMVVSTLTGTPVAVGPAALDWDDAGRLDKSGLDEKVLLANGMT
ncbi:hypothetical protein V5O48_017997, partial [Marasmius crinis-equi]